VCIDVLYGDVLSRRRFVEETFCMCARTRTNLGAILLYGAHYENEILKANEATPYV
jgi:hypothetical protein